MVSHRRPVGETVSRLLAENGVGGLTVPVCSAERPLLRASTPTIVAISWIRALVSLALVVAERRRLNLALTQGCDETWILAAMMMCLRRILRAVVRCYSAMVRV